MAHNLIYDQLISQVAPGLERSIMKVLAEHIGQGNRIERKDLARQVLYGPGSFAKPSNTDDRKVRLAIASLQAQGYPILSDSGQGGYWLGKTDEIETYIAELESRRAALAEKIRALRRANKMAWINPPMPVVQERLF